MRPFVRYATSQLAHDGRLTSAPTPAAPAPSRTGGSSMRSQVAGPSGPFVHPRAFPSLDEVDVAVGLRAAGSLEAPAVFPQALSGGLEGAVSVSAAAAGQAEYLVVHVSPPF